MKTIFISGSLAYDRIMNFPGLFRDHFVEDKLHNINVSFLVETLEEQFGGTAGNIAYNLALLGESPQIIATAGRDFALYETWLKSHGIDTSSIRRDLTKHTASASMMTDRGNNQISSFYPGAAAVGYGELSAKPDIAIIAAGGVSDMISLPSHYRSLSIPFYFDPGQQMVALSVDQVRDGITGAAGVFVNDYELSLIEKKVGWGEKEILEHAQSLIVTLGAEGSRIITAQKEERVPAVKIDRVVDPTGAGDAYRAGYLAGIARALSLQTCARIGSVVASFAIQHVGTQKHHFTLKEISERYSATYAETLAM